MTLAETLTDLTQHQKLIADLKAKHWSLRKQGVIYHYRYSLRGDHTCAVCNRKLKTGERILTDKQKTYMHYSVESVCAQLSPKPFSSESTPMAQELRMAEITGGRKKVERLLSPPSAIGPAGTYKTKPAPKPAAPARLRLRRQALKTMVRPVAIAA